MASERTLRPKREVDWRKLHFGEELPSLRPKVARNTLPDTYEVERLITKKHVKNEGELFLVKWKNYHINESTWEPRCHLTTDIINTYENPEISHERLQYAAQNIEKAFQHRLSSNGNRIVLDFDADVFRYCFGTDANRIVNQDEFRKLPLSQSWHYKIKRNGRGSSISFPVRCEMRVHFRKSYIIENGTVRELKTPNERLTIISAVEGMSA